MGSKYSTKYYDAADAEYQKALQEYTGEAGTKKVIEAGNTYGVNMAEAQGQTAGAQARANARNSGLSRGASAIQGQQATNQAVESGYNSGFGTAANIANSNNQAYVQGKAQRVANAAGIDTNRQNQKNSNMSGIMQGVGTAAAIGALALSDERCKDIRTADELLSKLRGER